MRNIIEVSREIINTIFQETYDYNESKKKKRKLCIEPFLADEFTRYIATEISTLISEHMALETRPTARICFKCYKELKEA